MAEKLLTVREVQTATDGDHSDGGGLLLRVRGKSSSWVFRYTAATGRRREMGLGPAHRVDPKLTGKGMTTARQAAADQRGLLQRALDPIDERDKANAAKRAEDASNKATKTAERLTLCRVARAYHEHYIEPANLRSTPPSGSPRWRTTFRRRCGMRRSLRSTGRCCSMACWACVRSISQGNASLRRCSACVSA